MDFLEQIKQFSSRAESLRGNLKTEEATKTSLVMPFFNLLGYDIFNPLEFVPEYICDVGTKKGEKVDYAIMQNGEPTIIIEAKACDVDLNSKHINQLYRYFSVTKAKFGILTNGIVYKFYSDLEEPNKMDENPFLEVDILNLKDKTIEELKRFRKNNFAIKEILDSASELKYCSMIKKVLAEQLEEPSDQFVKAILSKGIYSGVKTQNVIDKFRAMVKFAFNEYINEIMNEKIKNALDSSSIKTPSQANEEKKEKVIEFTSEELELLDYLKNMINEKELVYKKTDRYISLQLGDNIRKWICRIYIKKNSEKTFILHKYDYEDYECEYYFEEAEQLEQIKDLILRVANYCKK